MSAPANIPSGIAHLKLVVKLEAATYAQSARHLRDTETESQTLIGTSLSALYQASTCHRKCHGGPHIFEALCGRMYNLGVGAYLLAQRGLYDEALNLTRSIGEAANLIALSVVDKEALKQWLNSDKKTRLKMFSPSAIRKALERQEPRLVLATDDWYSRFCETYTHITPQTKPNMHNTYGRAHVGGVYQEHGLDAALDELATVLTSVAMIVCRYFKFFDLFDEISTSLRSARMEVDDDES
jgi:hypothetical protein